MGTAWWLKIGWCEGSPGQEFDRPVTITLPSGGNHEVCIRLFWEETGTPRLLEALKKAILERRGDW